MLMPSFQIVYLLLNIFLFNWSYLLLLPLGHAQLDEIDGPKLATSFNQSTIKNYDNYQSKHISNSNENNSFQNTFNQNQPNNDLGSSDFTDDSSSTVNDETPKIINVCITLNPAHVSTRNSAFISYECSAQICTDTPAKTLDQYMFRKPLFDWNSQLDHLLLTNGTCNSNHLTCWNKIDISMDSLMDTMEENGLNKMEIRCNVADYIRSYDGFNYVIGEATSIVKHFKGNRAHEPCNKTEDCGENLLCTQDKNTYSFDQTPANGFCECPSESLSVGSDFSKLTSFILVDDEKYSEQLCVETRSINETCQYDQQCQATDSNTYCRPTYTGQGIATSESVCDCAIGFQIDQSAESRCINMTAISVEKEDLLLVDESMPASSSTQANATASDSGTSPVVYVWWVFPSHSTGDQPAVTGGQRHGLFYYLNRYVTIRHLTYVLVVLTVLFPLIIIVISFYIYFQGKLLANKQFQHRRTSFTDSIGFSEMHTVPPSPDIPEKQKPVKFFGQNPLDMVLEHKNKHNDDKFDLVKNDQLDCEFSKLP